LPFKFPAPTATHYITGCVLQILEVVELEKAEWVGIYCDYTPHTQAVMCFYKPYFVIFKQQQQKKNITAYFVIFLFCWGSG